MDDLISRQAAIDAFLTELTKRERKNLLHTWSTVEVKYFITKMLEKIPSAQPEQPEIVQCKDCKYLLPKGSFCSKDMCGLRGMAHYHNVDIHNDFCSWAERREE